VREDPLELLSRERLRHFLAAAALAKGALLVVRPGEDGARLAWLCRRLARCAAVPVATVFNHR